VLFVLTHPARASERPKPQPVPDESKKAHQAATRKFTRAAAASMRFVSDSSPASPGKKKPTGPKASGRTAAGDAHP